MTIKRMRMPARWFAFAAMMTGALCAIAQQATPAKQPPPSAADTPTLQVNVKVVTLPVTVRDKHGKMITNLGKDDFTLTEDGRPQTIRYFNLDTKLPLTLGLLVDTSRSMSIVLDQERSASEKFLDQMLTQPQDRAFVLHFDRQVELLQDVTSDKEKLQKALKELEPSAPGDSEDGSDSGSGHSSRRRAGTQLYDAIYLASNDLTKKLQGRKALIILSDGVDRGSKESLSEAVEAAERAETVVYAIYIKGEEEPHQGQAGNSGHHSGGVGYPGGGGWPGSGGGGGNSGGSGGGRGGQGREQEPHVDGKKLLTEICDKTGGRLFEAKKKDQVDGIYSQIADELRSQYMLGYTPDKQSSSGFHAIHLAVKNKDLVVQTREGYYAGH